MLDDAEHRGIGDPQAAHEAGLDAGLAAAGRDLWSGAVHNHHIAATCPQRGDLGRRAHGGAAHLDDDDHDVLALLNST